MTSLGAGLFAILALLPAVTGAPPPLHAADAGTAIAIALCSGGAILLSPGGSAPAPSGTAPCCAKGCHASDRRRKLDQEQ